MTTRIDLAGLTTRIVEPRSAPKDPSARPLLTCILFHGFGASGDDLVPMADALDASVRFVFPAAPLELGGLYGDARAWWMLDLARLEADQRRGVASDRRAEIPDGLAEARAQVMRLLEELETQHAMPADRLVLGGFSQGAMLALDVALHRATPPAGVIMMSGTPLAASIWQPRLASLAGVPVMVSHGRQDGLLPFAAAEWMRDQLTGAGAVVDWQPFDGGHEIPRRVLVAANALLRAAT